MHCLLFGVSQEFYTPRPIGLYRIAHVLREHNWDVEVIDYAKHWSLDQLKTLARSRINKTTKFLGFSHLFSVWPSVLEEFCHWVNINWPDLIFISGSSVNPLFDTEVFDYYIQGFGEHAILELLRYLFSNGQQPIFNLTRINKGRVISANKYYPAHPMRTPMIKYQDRDFIQASEWLGIEFSRGCKFSCDFCNFPVLGVKGDYTRNSDDFYEQIMDAYDRFGVMNYTVVDETFNDRTEKITKFADVVEQLPFQPFFTGFIRADLLISRPRDREELLRMNFLGHYYGIESFNTQSARAVGKGMDGDKVKAGLLDIKDYFLSHGRNLYRGTISLIIGLPHESLDSIHRSKAWIDEHWADQHVRWFALDIVAHELVTQSKMSLDYKKYGYKLIKITEPVGNQGWDGTWGGHGGKTYVDWENDYMNRSKAIELQETFNTTDIKLGAFEIAAPGLATDIKQRLNQSCKDMGQVSAIKFVNQYIHNKLNYQYYQ